jgi:hypothetical protein
MDRSMKNPSQPSSRLTAAEWEALIARIQSPSKELEANLAKSNSNLIEALSGLDELENLTQNHLFPIGHSKLATSATPTALVAEQSATQAQAPKAQAPEVKYQTSHEEYAPALNQSALVEALLQYQRKKALRTPKPADTSANRPVRADEFSTPAFTRSDFVPMKVPAIHAEPKAAPLGRSATPGVRLPVLRLKSEGSTSQSNPTSTETAFTNSPGNSDDDQA